MKIYINNLSEDWVVDRFRKEWHYYNSNEIVNNLFSANILWLIAPWTFNMRLLKLFPKKKVVYSAYHFEDDKLKQELDYIKKIDPFIDCYHTISKETKNQLEKITDKDVHYIPFWIDPNIWFEIKDKSNLYEKYNLNPHNYFIGSFQRDSLRNDPNLPKLIKGPDIFLENIIMFRKEHPNLEVLLSGRKRRFLINELEKNKIPYKYFEMASQSEINELYNCLDLYIISSRKEGGPQAVTECGITNTPLISTNVGMVEDFLHPESIYQNNALLAKPHNDYLLKKIEKLILPQGFDNFFNMFDSI